MHNYPGIPVGEFAIRPGPIMAAADPSISRSRACGGHAARPHQCIDCVLVGAQVINQLQSIVSRNVDPLEVAVISICQFNAGNAHNVIPQSAGSRHHSHADARSAGQVEKRVREVVEGTRRASWRQDRSGLPAQLSRDDESPAADRVCNARRQRWSAATGRAATPRRSWARKISRYMLKARPGAFIFVGNGNSAGLHHPSYNFNDEAISTARRTG